MSAKAKSRERKIRVSFSTKFIQTNSSAAAQRSASSRRIIKSDIELSEVVVKCIRHLNALNRCGISLCQHCSPLNNSEMDEYTNKTLTKRSPNLQRGTS